MHPTLPRLEPVDFPALKRGVPDTLQVNLGYLCNQQCLHCHVAASPSRTELMTRETVDQVIAFLDACAISTLDLTGGAPEMNPHFRELVCAARERDVRVIDRCNLTILLEPGYEDLADFLAAQSVELPAKPEPSALHTAALVPSHAGWPGLHTIAWQPWTPFLSAPQ